MRRRLVAALVGTTFAVIALYAVPRAYFLAGFVEDQEQRELEHAADLVAAAVVERQEGGRPISEEFLAGLLHEGEGIELVRESAPTVRVGAVPDEDDDIVVSRSIEGTGRLELVRSADQVGGMVAQALLPLLALGGALLLLSGLVGVVLARRLAQPFQELSDAAEQLGRGRFDASVPHYDVPEAEAIGGALRHAASRLDVLVGRERDFAVNASHQLLTPLAGLRLELEDLSMWPQTPPDVAAQLTASLADVDRLAGAVDGLLGGARSAAGAPAVDVDLSSLTSQAADRWRPAVEAVDRELAHRSGTTVTARVAPEAVMAILDVLLDNAITHGEGRITVDATELESHLRVRVVDEGRRSVPSDVLHRPHGTSPGSGRGLARAAELAESAGGFLRVDDTDQTTMVLMLPKRSRTPTTEA